MKKQLFIFGYGYTAASLTKRLMREDGWHIVATSRDSSKRKELKRLGVEAFDWEEQDAIAHQLANSQYLLCSIPPGKQGDPTLKAYGTQIASHPWQWIGYLSSTGVYGDHGGAWVDETSRIDPQFSPRIQRRIEAEASWQQLARKHHLPVHLFRLAGIYGPGRNIIAELRNGRTLSVYSETQFFSRIHVDDIGYVLHQSMQQPDAKGTIYNLADDLPAPSHEVMEYAAKLLNQPPPLRIPYEEAELSEMGAEFWRANKRVSNAKIKHDLGLTLQFPSYREGLESLL